jgi:tryptophan-rich sensory protein
MRAHGSTSRRSVASAGTGYAIVVLVGFVAAVLAIGLIASSATLSARTDWYAKIVKPDFTPPDWVFGPVWTLLYLSMAIAAWLAWRAEADQAQRDAALRAFWVQLALNLAWSWIFFRARDFGWALVEILILLAAIAICVRRFWRITPAAGALMLPYFAWTCFATILTLRIYQLNPR